MRSLVQIQVDPRVRLLRVAVLRVNGARGCGDMALRNVGTMNGSGWVDRSQGSNRGLVLQVELESDCSFDASEV